MNIVFHEESSILAEKTLSAGIANSLTGDTLCVSNRAVNVIKKYETLNYYNMKKITVIILIIITTNLTVQAQVKKAANNLNIQQPNKIAAYQLFSTQNIWNFIKLDTRNGQMWQVQFDAEGGNRGETILNSILLVTKEKETAGRFTLYPTQNTWTFILLDQIDGNTWQIQWSTEPKERLVIPIN